MEKFIIAPSILSASFANLEKELDEVYSLGCKVLHFDVMDGHFVKNISFGSHVLSTINQEHKLFNDVHLMVSDPKFWINDFVKAKADNITFHYEALKDNNLINELITYIHSFNIKCGISINPKTDVKVLLPFLDKIDLILLMSVEPGFGGQAFNEEIYKKIEVLQGFKNKNNYKFAIEVDGGVNLTNTKNLVKLGANILVYGSYIFNSKNKKDSINRLYEEVKDL